MSHFGWSLSEHCHTDDHEKWSQDISGGIVACLVIRSLLKEGLLVRFVLSGIYYLYDGENKLYYSNSCVSSFTCCDNVMLYCLKNIQLNRIQSCGAWCLYGHCCHHQFVQQWYETKWLLYEEFLKWRNGDLRTRWIEEWWNHANAGSGDSRKSRNPAKQANPTGSAAVFPK